MNNITKEGPASVEVGGASKTNRSDYRLSNQYNQASCEQEFREAMGQAGIDHPPSEIIGDSRFHYFTSAYKTKPNTNCRYIFHGTHGYFCDWSKGIEGRWSTLNNPNAKLTRSQRAEIQKSIETTEHRLKEEELARHKKRAQDAQTKWESLAETGTSKYLERKKVKPFGVRFGKDYVAIPLRDTDGNIWNLQRIFDEPLEDIDTDRVFMKGARKKGYFHIIGTIQEGELFYVCEGFATGCSIRMATGKTVIIAFDCYNFIPVIETLKNKYPKNPITICADDDRYKDANRNPGKENAEKAANMFDCGFALPKFKDTKTQPTDFNDLHRLEGLEEVRNQLENAKSEDSWPAPQPIKSELLPVESLPLEIIPEPFQPWLQDIAHRMQCPLEHVAIPAMVMLGSIIGTRCGIRPKEKDNWLIIPNLWGGIIGNPSTLKSPALAEALRPLAYLEDKARKEFEEKQADHDCNIEAHKILKETQVSKIKQAVKSENPTSLSTEDIKNQLKALSEPEKPICKRFKTNDATIEKMTELLEENSRGLLLFRDELIGLLAAWDKEGREPDRAFYLEAWNGYGSHITDRIGRGTTHCKNMCVSILGGTQPSKILGYLHRAIRGIENDGLLQRFQLLVYPDENKAWQLIDESPNKGAQNLVFKLIEAIATMNFPENGALQEDSNSIPYFHFSKEAQEVFNEWLTELETSKLRGNEDPIIIEHLAKYRKLMPALALMIHIVDVAAGKPRSSISLQSAEKAAAWCDFLELHAKRIYGMVTNIATQAASILSKKLKKKELEDGFTARDVYRKGWSLLSNKEEVEAACDELVKAGWLKEVITPPSSRQKGKVEYLINPKIWS